MSGLWEVLTEHLPEFSSGFFVTFRLVAISFVIAMVVGTLVAAMRVAPVRWLNVVGGVYVEFFRNIPLLVLLIIAFAGLRRAGVPINGWVAGIGSLGLYTASYIAEALRSGVFAVGRGQIDAALSLGLSYPRTLRRIVLPQAFRTVIPALASLIIAMIKNSAIVGASIVALPDLLKESRQVQAETFQTNEVFFWAAVGYLVLTLTATLAFRYFESRFQIRR
ncbi:MAG: ABC transporter permease subunit [Solirubrobacterales bacterium]|nr:ABC transporter permease subunit [Solirubrobacterales bacterium]